ncbi:hypothetical protein BD779DRAFT_1492906 [Infundibulicybe gibba]|nr:hypothetical protein BD779DRAFT_1492906 [Infundibulicybe gibba]
MILLSPLYNKPNTILAKQKAYQNDARLIMHRLPRSNLYLGLFGVTFVAGMVGTTYGMFSLVKGKPSE